ncbi:MAG: TSUP family transporter, partial [Oscillospiraceae bacterium]
MEISILTTVFVSFAVFLAGFVDSIAGGGGLISLPAYYAVGIPPHMALGTNKFSSTCGTAIATTVYLRNKS